MTRRRLVALVLAVVVVLLVVAAALGVLLGIIPWHAPTDGGYWGGI